MNIVLSSTSLQRQRLLKQLNINFTTFAPDIDETPLITEAANALVTRLAKAKALAATTLHSNSLIIGSDTVGELHHTILNKPLTHANAVQQLIAMSGQKVRFYTGLCVYSSATQVSQCAVETYDVFFKTLALEKIEAYLIKDQPYYCSGSIKAEGLGMTLIERFAGKDFSTLIGLPLLKLIQFLEYFGVIL